MSYRAAPRSGKDAVVTLPKCYGARMRWPRVAVPVLLAAAALVACGQPAGTHTAAELREAIAAYKRGDAGATEDRIAALFAKLDAEVATVRADELAKPPAERAELTQRREGLEADRRDLQGEYVEARVTRLGVQAQDALKGMADQLGRGLEDMGRSLRESSRATEEQKP